MKKFLLSVGTLLLATQLFAQAPQKMTYQAVVRNASNTIVANAGIGLKISILKDNPNGAVVYSETHQPSTNVNGLFSIQIGGGTVQSGTFSSIDWANDDYFVKTEIDPTGGTNYTITNTSQFLSVPYAFHAKTAESVSGPITVTETDPLFSASPAAGITSTNITNWNNKQEKLTVSESASTSQLNISTVSPNLSLINGTTLNINLNAGDKVLLIAEGGLQCVGIGSTYAIAFTVIRVNSTNNLSERITTLANTTGGVGNIAGHFNQSVIYTATSTGNHSFAIYGAYADGTASGINFGGTSDAMKATLKAIIIK